MNKNEFQKQMGANIRYRRKGARMTQDQLSTKVNISRPSLANIEAGRQGVDAFLITEIARVLAAPVEVIIPFRTGPTP